MTVSDCRQYSGAISGANAGTFLENYFVSDSLAGINRMSYADCAQPVTYAQLLAHFDAGEATTLPDEFRKFNLSFVADGETLYSEVFDYGASFSSAVFPNLPEKQGYYAHWDIEKLDNLCFDTTVTAVYEPYISSLHSEAARFDGRPVFFAEGAFAQGDTLTVTSLPVTSQTVDLSGGVENIIEKSLAYLKTDVGSAECWRLQLSGDGEAAHTFRYLPPDGDAEHITVFIEQNGQWHDAETRVIGSYVAFEAEGNDVHVSAVGTGNTRRALLVAALVLAAALLLAFSLLRCFGHSGKHTRAHIAARQDVESNMPPTPPRAKKKKHPRLVALLVLLSLLLVLFGIAVCYIYPGLIADKGAYEIISAFVEKNEAAMELESDLTLGTKSYPLSVHIERTTADGRSITSVSSNGIMLYYSDGAVFMENGNGYQISSELPDYSQLIEYALELYSHVKVEELDGVYSVTATAADAKTVSSLLFPTVAAYLPDTDNVRLCLYTEDKKLSMLTFSGNGRLNDENATPYELNAALTLAEKPTHPIPDAVLDAVADGEYKSSLTLTEDFLRLLTGWQKLNNAEPLCADIAFQVDCGVLKSQESLRLYRWHVSDEEIYSVQKNGYGLYFTQDGICDANGIGVSAANAANLDTARLLNIAYTACMNTSARCTRAGERYTYTLSLDSDGMAELAHAIAPESGKMNIKYDEGSVVILSEGEEIRSIDFKIDSSVYLVLSTAETSIKAIMDFKSTTDTQTPPEPVINALVKEK